MRIFTGGCYYFNSTSEEWEGVGVSVEQTDRIFTYCSSNHLTSYGTGFFKTQNAIDFDFIFADFDYADNMTIFMVLLVTIIFFLITLIWAQIHDIMDNKRREPHWMGDNLAEDHYFYEVLVQTGPMLSHGTESKVQFILTGEENETQIRTLSDPDQPKKFFRKGALDAFLMAVDKPLGHLQYIKIWHDNSGIREMQPWHLSYLIIHDIQTGEKFRFFADKWLAIDREEFQSDTQLPVSLPDGELKFGYLFKQGIFNVLNDDHIFWSVFSRPVRSRFTRTQRTCVAMAALYQAMLNNALWFGARDYVTDPFFKLNKMLSFSTEEVLIGVLSAASYVTWMIIIVFCFRKSRRGRGRASRFDSVIQAAAQQGRVSLPEKMFTAPEPGQSGGWPGYTFLLGWLFTLATLLLAMAVTALQGIQFSNMKTYQWLTSIVVNFFYTMFIVEPLKVLVFTVWAAARRKPDWDQDHCDADEKLPTIYHDPEDASIAGRMQKNKAEMPELDPAYLEPLRFRRVQEGEMNAVIQDILVYLVYLSIVIVVAQGNRDPNSFYMKDNLMTTLVHGGLTCGRPGDGKEDTRCKEEEDLPTWSNPFTGRTEYNPYVDFMKVREVNHWWLWLNKTLIPNVRVQNWYNGDPPYGLRGYLDDRVNRIIGYALVRQVRERPGTCNSPKLMRDYVDSCTGDMELPIYFEDDKYYCMGWKPLISENCTRMPEYEYKTEDERQSRPLKADYNRYSGGGYELKMKGHIDKLKAKLVTLQENNWIDNRTRALITEFSVYNAQVNMFGVVRIVAEFVGGGVTPWARIDVIRLTRTWSAWSTKVVVTCEVLFILSTFYYFLNTLSMLKSMGCSEFFRDSWNIVDIFTILLSMQAILLWGLKAWVVMEMTKKIGASRGNEFIPIERAQIINKYYDYTISMNVFTSMLKLCRLLSFQKAFRQIAATIKLCFVGLSTFVVEFVIVFGSFCCFFYFVLSAELRNFYKFSSTVENTIAMSIGKFNFGSLRAASEMAAWIFFVFSIVVNMILINMMMAIINMAFEDIKSQSEAYKNKFEIMEYIKRSMRELSGVNPAKREFPKFKDGSEDLDGDGIPDNLQAAVHEDKSLPVEFSDKTNQLLEYIEKTYLKGMVKTDKEGKAIIEKMQLAENSQKAKAMEYGFDNIFAEGPTPTPSAMAGDRTGPEMPELSESQAEDFVRLGVTDQDALDNVSMSNVDGMNM